jgi:hypothetical protein
MRQDQDTILQCLGKALHLHVDELTHEPLPSRWVDLIHHLDEQEQKGSARQAKGATEQCSTKQAHVGPGLAGAELAVTRQEEVLRELLLTGEPTEKAKALLKDLRRRVAQALIERH